MEKRYKELLISCPAIAISATGTIFLTLLIIYANLLQTHMPEILSWAGVSRYHIDHYYTNSSFVQVYRLGLLFSCFLIFTGGILYFLRTRILNMSSSVVAPLGRLFAIQCSQHCQSLITKFDRYAAFTLLGTASIVMLASMFTIPIRSDEAAMYDSVSSSILPLWAVAYISPNNHVGYASLVWLGHFLWGDSIPGMRVFSFLAWSISTIILFQIYLELSKRDCCFSLIAVSMTLPMVMTLGVLSRGYSIGAMLIYAALLMVLRGQTVGDTLLTGFVASLALWMVPSMFYGIILIYGIILWKHWNDKKYAFLISSMFCLVSMLGAIAFYLPILLVSGVENLLANPYVVSRRATISSMYGNWLSNLFFGECKVGQDCPLFSGPAASMAFLSAALHRIFYLPKRHLIVLALLPLAAVFLFPLLHGRLPPPRTLAFMGPIILLFWGGAVTPKMHLAYGGLALITLFVIFAQRTSIVQNDISSPSNDAQDAANTIATSPPTIVQTKHWADYACLRFYLRRAGWKGIVNLPIARFDAPWLFDGSASHLWHANHAPEGYKPTSVKGLYRADARIQ